MAYDMGIHSDTIRARAAREVLTSTAPLVAAETAAFYPGPGKRLFDIVFVLFFAVPMFLIVTLLALLVATDGRSPFYTQKRVGLNGKVFRMYKLRSMVTDADKVAGRLPCQQSRRTG